MIMIGMVLDEVCSSLGKRGERAYFFFIGGEIDLEVKGFVYIVRIGGGRW